MENNRNYVKELLDYLGKAAIWLLLIDITLICLGFAVQYWSVDRKDPLPYAPILVMWTAMKYCFYLMIVVFTLTMVHYEWTRTEADTDEIASKKHTGIAQTSLIVFLAALGVWIIVAMAQNLVGPNVHKFTNFFEKVGYMLGWVALLLPISLLILWAVMKGKERGGTAVIRHGSSKPFGALIIALTLLILLFAATPSIVHWWHNFHPIDDWAASMRNSMKDEPRGNSGNGGSQTPPTPVPPAKGNTGANGESDFSKKMRGTGGEGGFYGGRFHPKTGDANAQAGSAHASANSATGANAVAGSNTSAPPSGNAEDDQK